MCRCISVVDMIKWLMLFCISSLLIYAPSLGTQTSTLASETLHLPLWWWNKSVSLSLLHWPYKRKHQHESSSPICQNILLTLSKFHRRYFLMDFFFLIGIHSMQGWTATTRHGFIKKKKHKKDFRLQKICLERTYS